MEQQLPQKIGAPQAQLPHHGTHVLHVREDSDSALQALFDLPCIKNPLPEHGSLGSQTSSSLYRNKKLPASFFNQPLGNQGLGNHSRDGSQDSTNYGPTGLQVVHNRSRSSPAQLPHSTLSAAPPPPQHIKQVSVDFSAELGAAVQQWDLNKNATGQTYFGISPNEQNPAWKAQHTQALNQQQQLSPNQSHLSPNVSLTNLNQALPAGWEQAVTADGEIYFINHMDKNTSWFDPRLPKHVQRPGPMRMSLSANQLQLAPPPLMPQSPQQQLSPGQPPQAPAAPVGALQAPPPIQQAPQAQGLQNVAGGGGGGARLGAAPNDQYLRLELQKLQREKERLQQKQQDLARKEVMLKDLFTPPSASPSELGGATGTSQPTMSSAMQSVSSSGVDPFLGQSQESHARQNSADSGLGGMGTSYSLPRTPEDFLSNVDEMDSTDGGQKMQKPVNVSDFNLGDLHGMSMDVSNMGDPGDSNTAMDSDELVPSLSEDLSMEMLKELGDVQKDNLLWI